MTHVRRLPVTTAGLLLGVLAAVIAMTAGGRAIVTGPARLGTATLTIDLPAGVVWVFVAAAGVLLAATSLGALWAKLVGAAVMFATAGTAAFMVAIAKTSTRFHPEAVPQLAVGGRILAAAFVVGIVGVVTVIVGSRELLPPPQDRAMPRDASGLPVRPGSAGVAVGFSLLGVIFFPVAPVGVMLGLLAYWRIIDAEDEVPGRNLALTAIILGTTWISLWTIVVFGAGIWSAHTI